MTTFYKTIDGYEVDSVDIVLHRDHDPRKDRWDDCPLCWADVISDEQRDWLMELGQTPGLTNNIAETMGLLPQSS